jgi:hypothetical protein
VMTQLGELNRDESIDRRRFLRRAGTVAWSTPVIMTVLASRAGAQPCLVKGQGCSPTTPGECCTGLICCSDPNSSQLGTCRQSPNTPCETVDDCCQNCSGNPKTCKGS